MLALLGSIVAVSMTVPPASTLAVALSSVTPVTETTVEIPLTFTEHEADWLPQVAVIVQSPFPTAVTIPFETVATFLLLLSHVTESVVSVGKAVATTVCCPLLQ